MACLLLTAVRAGLQLLCVRKHILTRHRLALRRHRSLEVPQMEPVVFLGLSLISAFYQEAHSLETIDQRGSKLVLPGPFCFLVP